VRRLIPHARYSLAARFKPPSSPSDSARIFPPDGSSNALASRPPILEIQFLRLWTASPGPSRGLSFFKNYTTHEYLLWILGNCFCQFWLARSCRSSLACTFPERASRSEAGSSLPPCLPVIVPLLVFYRSFPMEVFFSPLAHLTAFTIGWMTFFLVLPPL